MGGSRRGQRLGAGGLDPLTSPVALRVVPAIPSFALDDGFSYSSDVSLPTGTIVRVPLGGRTVRGFVVGTSEDEPATLKEIKSVSSPVPVFGDELLETLNWAATHYVAPRSALLAKTGPPNLPRAVEAPPVFDGRAAGDSPVPAATRAARERRHIALQYLLVGSQWVEPVAAIVTPVIADGLSVMLILPTAAEVERAEPVLRRLVGRALTVVVPGQPDRVITDAWNESASGGGRLVMGSPRVALWPIADLSMAVVVQEGRRALKDRQTPTVHARELLRRRAVIERFSLVFVGQVPSSDLVAAGIAVSRLPGRNRAWPHVEIVDRSSEPPDGRLLTDRTAAAIRATVNAGEPALLFTHRHGYAAASRCASCRELRLCPRCGSRPDPGTECRRCGSPLGACVSCGGKRFVPLGAGARRVEEEARRRFGRESVGLHRAVRVVTERDLTSVGLVALAAVVDADGLVLGTNYRSAEEALRIMARVATRIRPGGGRRLIVQTTRPSHRVIAALEKGDPIPFMQTEVSQRSRDGFPPAGELIVVELRPGSEEFDPELRQAVEQGVTVLGPARAAQGMRWLVQGRRLAATKTALRPLLQRARDRDQRIRVDVDPLDL